MTKRAKGKVLLYYNAYSGSGIFKNNLDHIIERCQEKGYLVTPVRAANGVMIDRALSEIDESEYSRIIVAGGDGTINICVNSMVRYDIHLPLGILPAGTANDFAFYFEIRSDIDLALDVALGEKTTKADVGVVNGQCFINVCAMGAMVDVSQKTDPNLKNALGTLAYYLKAATEIPQIHPIPIKIKTTEQVLEEKIYFLTVLNGESAGGFRKLSPNASMQDGMLDVVAFRKMPIVEFGPLLFEVINGRHPENKNVLYFQAEDFVIESEENIATDTDGEKGPDFPLRFSVLKKRLDVFVSEETWNYD
ncbi:MAG: YegS/Rv2252/BmrU family lipid kinase [Clostridiales bacterium]|nr:YegS/Rv2252/BmrU family lipid kinase [Clostridiales bacterium]MDD7036249.1 YegS/Rv2252/BmrU family lipid kinase [Bacillota bacterium]MDY2920893.1 YegS/Rv2252/BmrU family lipid kinase [Lentihominibacter sp.]